MRKSLLWIVAACALSVTQSRAALVLTGHEFDGYSPTYQVQYNPATYTFGDGGNTSNTVPYDIYFRADSQYVYFMFKALPGGTSDLSTGLPSDLRFVNIYLSTDIPSGSNIGFEVTNNRAFVPGVPGYYDNLDAYGLVTLNHMGTPTTDPQGTFYEFALPWTYFTTDPQGLGFAKLTPGGELQIRISQSFGYNPVYGTDQPVTRLGLVTYAAAVPEPGSVVLGLTAVLAGAALSRSRRCR